ncbi:MAG: hypothetical protein M1401_08050 [Chloroflexi bacterium]|nr:hypothetical protein [Chloroflexota bacterium]
MTLITPWAGSLARWRSASLGTAPSYSTTPSSVSTSIPADERSASNRKASFTPSLSSQASATDGEQEGENEDAEGADEYVEDG